MKILGPAAASHLATLGFKKRAGPIYTLELTDEVLGWLGLNTASEHYPSGVVEVNPVVGVRHQPVERLVAELQGTPFHAYLPATISSPIGYVMPYKRYAAWVVDTKGEGMESELRSLAGAVERYGLPFMREASDLPALCRLLDEQSWFEQLAYRRPVAWLLAGDPARARDDLAVSMQKLGGRTDAAAELLRRFADALRQRLGA